MKRIGLLGIFCCVVLGVWGQSEQVTQTVKGRIVESELEQPVEMASVLLQNEQHTFSTYSDVSGRFKIEEVPLGSYEVVVSAFGHEPRSMGPILVSAGKEKVLEVPLVEQIQELEAVTVEAEEAPGQNSNEMATVSARKFSVAETQRYAGSLDDPGRMAQTFAGATMNDDGTNEIVIRGNSPRGLLWRLEGMEIPNPNHFADQGASGGPISMLSGSMLTNSDFYTGAFPAQYGNAASGVFDIKMRKGNAEKREYTMKAGLLGLDFAAEGPGIGSNSSYLMNYRYSTLAMLNTIGLDIVGDAVPVFQDLSFHVHTPLQNQATLGVYGIGGLSRIQEQWDIYQDSYQTDLGIVGVNYRQVLAEKHVVKLALGYSGTRNSYFEEEEDTLNGSFFPIYDEKFVQQSYRLSAELKSKLNARNTIHSGVIGTVLDYNMYSEFMNEDTGVMEEDLRSQGNAERVQAFSSWKHRFSEDLSFTAGVHYMHFLYNDNFSVEPRLGMRWNFAPAQTLTFGAGIHSKLEDLPLYMAKTLNVQDQWVQANKDLELSKAAHFVLGYERVLGPKMQLKVEAYYQQLYDVPVSSDPTSYASAINLSSGYTTIPMINEGLGRNYGIEVTLEKFLSKGFYYMGTVSLYNSEFQALDGKWRNTAYNGNYVFNALGGKEFKIGESKTRYLSLNLKGVWAGGRRTTPIKLDESALAGYTIRDRERLYEDQMGDYLRLDFQVSLRREKKRVTESWKLDIQNTTNRENPYQQYYNPNTGGIYTSTQLGILPILSYQVQF